MDEGFEIKTNLKEYQWSFAAISLYDDAVAMPNPTLCFNCNAEFLLGQKIIMTLAEVEHQDNPARVLMTFQLCHLECPE